MTAGITTRPAEMRLTERAADYLAGGPADVVALIGHICQLPNPPRVVAEHMATALFAGRVEFVRDDAGRWALASALSTAAAAPTIVREASVGEPAAGATAAPAGGTSAAEESPVAPPAEAAAPAVSSPPAHSRVERPVKLPLIDPLAPPRGYEPRERAIPSAFPARFADVPAAPTACEAADLLASLSYVVVDVETTGTRPWAGDRVTEIAAVVVRDGAVQEVFETLVNPQRPIPPFITALTNISWAMVKDAPVFGQVCDRLLAVMRGNVFVAHNAAFDWRFVTAEVARANGLQMAGRQLCTVRLARKLLPHLRSRSLDHVAM